MKFEPEIYLDTAYLLADIYPQCSTDGTCRASIVDGGVQFPELGSDGGATDASFDASPDVSSDAAPTSADASKDASSDGG